MFSILAQNTPKCISWHLAELLLRQLTTLYTLPRSERGREEFKEGAEKEEGVGGRRREEMHPIFSRLSRI